MKTNLLTWVVIGIIAITTLYFFIMPSLARENDAMMDITINYSDGTSETYTQSLRDRLTSALTIIHPSEDKVVSSVTFSLYAKVWFDGEATRLKFTSNEPIVVQIKRNDGVSKNVDSLVVSKTIDNPKSGEKYLILEKTYTASEIEDYALSNGVKDDETFTFRVVVKIKSIRATLTLLGGKMDNYDFPRDKALVGGLTLYYTVGGIDTVNIWWSTNIEYDGGGGGPGGGLLSQYQVTRRVEA